MSRLLTPLRSVFVELLGWADNAGTLPPSFVVAGLVLGVALTVAGLALLAVTGLVVLGVAVALVGIGLMFGTWASRPS